MLHSSIKRVCVLPARLQTRSLWRSSTAISSSPAALLRHLNSNPPPATSTILFSISKNVPPPLVDLIRAALAASSSSSVGCLSEVLPAPIARHLGFDPSPDTEAEPYSVAIATFHPNKTSNRAIPFLSTLQGRPNISLGREIKRGPREEEIGDSSDEGFEAFLSGKKWGFGDDSRRGAAVGLAELEGVARDSVKEIVSFTSDRQQPFLKTLASYTRSSTLGLVGSSTPFHSPTHAPYTLFFNDQLVSSGAVGVAIVDEAPARRIEVEYAGLEPLAEPLEVTSAKGNIVLTLANQNAARLLLHAVQQLPTSSDKGANSMYTRQEEKEKEFFAAVFEALPGKIPDLSLARHVSKIMAGDPSRGAISVSTEVEIPVGSYLLFLHRPSPSPLLPLLISPRAPLASLTPLSIAPSYSQPNFSKKAEGEEGEKVSEVGGFWAASENGVVLSRRGRESWVCGNEGVVVAVGR